MKNFATMVKLFSDLVFWYKQHRRPLPWRLKKPDPYSIWLVEVMSQQTVMAALLPYHAKFLARFPTVDDLAAASQDEVLRIWAGLGYYSRARNLHQAAQQIVALGGFPKDYEGWLSLKGIGPYTAAAIASQCFGVVEPVWDGNVLRVMSRFFGESSPYSTAFKESTLKSLKKIMTVCVSEFDLYSGDFNQALMELGAIGCTRQNPVCKTCPLQSGCHAYKHQNQDQLPPKKVRNEKVLVRANVLLKVNLKKNKGQQKTLVWLEKRDSKDLWYAGLWDFPSELGGVNTPVQKMSKLSAENFLKSKQLGIEPIKHSITHHSIELIPWVIAVKSTVKANDSGRPGKMAFPNSMSGSWFELESLLDPDLCSVPLATTAKKILKKAAALIVADAM